MNTKIALSLLTGCFLVTAVACTDSQTTSEAPGTSPTTTSQNNQSTMDEASIRERQVESDKRAQAERNDTTADPTSPQNTQAAMDDAQDKTRKRQLESDIRAREQRNDAMGNSTIRPDGDLASEVRSKLEANIPKSNLTIKSKDANVEVSGTVSSVAELNKIKSLAMEIDGVKTVTNRAAVASR